MLIKGQQRHAFTQQFYTHNSLASLQPRPWGPPGGAHWAGLQWASCACEVNFQIVKTGLKLQAWDVFVTQAPDGSVRQ